jgi:hypothetical protein
MKFAKQILIGVVAIGAAVFTAHASLGFDTYKAARTYILAPPQNLTVNGGVPTVTNGPIDLVRMVGTAAIFFDTVTNSGTTGGTLTAQLYGSADQTNLVAVANYYVITNTTSEYITNAYYGGTNLITTNTVLLPGTLTYPNGALAGSTTPYLTYSLATNTGAITLSGPANKTVEVGLNTDDQLRYLYVIYTAGGTITNFTTSAKVVTVQFAH